MHYNIRYVSHVTKTRDAREPGGGLVYIGHSMGTTAFWVMSDLRPEVMIMTVILMRRCDFSDSLWV